MSFSTGIVRIKWRWSAAAVADTSHSLRVINCYIATLHYFFDLRHLPRIRSQIGCRCTTQILVYIFTPPLRSTMISLRSTKTKEKKENILLYYIMRTAYILNAIRKKREKNIIFSFNKIDNDSRTLEYREIFQSRRPVLLLKLFEILAKIKSYNERISSS